MFENAIKILSIINDNGYEAFIVGGFVRDIYLSKESTDIDICTSATPKDILSIFKNNVTVDERYGSVKLLFNKYFFDITTFRRDISYKNNRKPSKIEYVDSLKEDLKRRDFTINTLCMDKDGNILDYYDAKKDIKKKIIKTIKDPDKSFNEDSLRILRCIRFSAELNFKIDKNTSRAIKKNSNLIKDLSFSRKKEELNKIFKSSNYIYGLKLINYYKLEKYLNIDKIKKIKQTSDVLGMWAQIDFDNGYPFTKLEKESIGKIKEILIYNKIDKFVLYEYGSYLSLIGAEIINVDKKEVIDIYNSLKIKSKSDIKVNVKDISLILNIKIGKKAKEIFNDLEIAILNDKVNNTKNDLKRFILENYKENNNEG